MFILIFFLVMSLSSFITNKMLGIDDNSEDSYGYNRRDSLFIGIIFILGIVLEILSQIRVDAIASLINRFYWYLVLIYGLTTLLSMIILSGLRKQEIERKRAELLTVYPIIKPLISKSKDDEIDFNDPGFTLEYKHGNINRITVPIEPTKFGSGLDKVLTPLVGQLNAFLTTYTWNYDGSKLDQRIIEFVGDDKPPTMVRWPGSWLSHFRFMPMGVSGKGEVGFKPDSIPKGQEGRSQQLDELGNPIQRVLKLPNAPQGMISGATGGGKSVSVQNIIIHCIEHRDKIALGLIDPKQVEFSNFSGMNGIVGVATNTYESVEILRIARQVMLKRNREMAQLGIKNIGEYKPHEKSGRVFVTGREIDETASVRCRIDGLERLMTASELADYLHEDFSREIEVCLNGETWIRVNGNCVDYIYTDEMKMLLIIVDELAELTLMSGLKDTRSKEEDAMKSEIISILQSIAQLGRSAAVHVLVCTQKPLANVVPTILRDNLVFKCFCGKATSPGASEVALGNLLATTVDNTYPGAGVLQAVGTPLFCRYYYSEFKDVDKYYKDRGLNEKGYDKSSIGDEVQLENLGGDEDIRTINNSTSFEFEGEYKDIDKRENQHWEEI